MTRIDRRTFLGTAGGAAISSALPGGQGTLQPQAAGRDFRSEQYTLAAYYFGNYHVDPRNEAAHGPGWTEWRLVEAAKPRFPGHAQPKVPLWGYEDESDPLVFQRKIKAAADAGIFAFIFDWYWYDDGPFLQRALEAGYLHAANRNDLQFAIMWANHDWFDIQPAKLGGFPHLQFPGGVTPATFEKLTDHIVSRYFTAPSYWKVEGCPYFSFYELNRFVLGMGGVPQAARALQRFREKTRSAGFPNLHLNAITWGVRLLPGQTDTPNLKTFLEVLGVDSTTSYVWVHHAEMNTFPVTQYDVLAQAYEAYRAGAAVELGKPYFPNVSMGWDSSPRACQSDMLIHKEYPFLPVLQGNTPEAFGRALQSAKSFLDRTSQPKNKIITLNSWNEWTEGSYLEPDTINRYGYLDQIRKVFPLSSGM